MRDCKCPRSYLSAAAPYPASYSPTQLNLQSFPERLPHKAVVSVSRFQCIQKHSLWHAGVPFRSSAEAAEMLLKESAFHATTLLVIYKS